jgi:hypothetical protein
LKIRAEICFENAGTFCFELSVFYLWLWVSVVIIRTGWVMQEYFFTVVSEGSEYIQYFLDFELNLKKLGFEDYIKILRKTIKKPLRNQWFFII